MKKTAMQQLIEWMKKNREAFAREMNPSAVHALNLAIVEAEMKLETERQDLIKAVMKANKIEEIPALLKISQTQTYQDSDIGQMMFMAAVVELIEPSK